MDHPLHSPIPLRNTVRGPVGDLCAPLGQARFVGPEMESASRRLGLVWGVLVALTVSSTGHHS